MNKVSSSLIKDSIIIIFIIIIFVSVFLVFYIEIIKYNKIKISKKNFYTVKEELMTEIKKCEKKEEKWIFNISCKNNLTKELLSDYFNETRKLTNPYDGNEGVEGVPGSVQINIENKFLILTIDVDANGGIDIEHRIYIN